jgi:hypothetical protein
MLFDIGKLMGESLACQTNNVMFAVTPTSLIQTKKILLNNLTSQFI